MRLTVMLAAYTIGFGGIAAACSCANVQPFCNQLPSFPSAYYSEMAIFIGHVTHADSKLYRSFEDAMDFLLQHGASERYRVVQFEVRERFVGNMGKTFGLATGWGECCDCSLDFEEGEEYLVVALRSPKGAWQTSICTRTRLARYATDDIDALRAKIRGQELSRRISGHLMVTRDEEYRPLAGVSVSLRAGNDLRTAITDADGYYRFEKLEEKQYRITSTRQGRSLIDGAVDLTTRRCADVWGFTP
jgi:hypothetical protein